MVEETIGYAADVDFVERVVAVAAIDLGVNSGATGFNRDP